MPSSYSRPRIRRQRQTYSDASKLARANVLNAFRDLRRYGIICRANYLCCRNCAGVAILNDFESKTPWRQRTTYGTAYWCRQTEQNFKQTGKLYINFGSFHQNAAGIGQSVLSSLRRWGVFCEWSGNPTDCIKVAESLDKLNEM